MPVNVCGASDNYDNFRITVSIRDTSTNVPHLPCFSNKSPTRCNNFPVYYPDVYLQLNMFREFSRPSSGAQ
jgi:hypothetical protein